jgi:hypothetical protein
LISWFINAAQFGFIIEIRITRSLAYAISFGILPYFELLNYSNPFRLLSFLSGLFEAHKTVVNRRPSIAISEL